MCSQPYCHFCGNEELCHGQVREMLGLDPREEDGHED